MKVYFSPIVWDKTIEYTFEGELLKITIDGITDEFDFSTLPDGKLDIYSIETTLSTQPITYAEKVDGVMFLTLLNPISEDATEAEKFPEWVEV